MSAPEATDPKVQEFLEELRMVKGEHYEIVERLRRVVHEVLPGTSERMMYGGIMFSLVGDYGGVFSYTAHVSFELGSGAFMDDPKGLLEGRGRLRRHLKFRVVDDVVDGDLGFFLRQADGA